LHQINEGTFPSLGALIREIADQVMEYGTLGKIPAAVVRNTRNDMYLASEAIRFLMKDKEADLSKEDIGSTPTAIPRTPTRSGPAVGACRSGSALRSRPAKIGKTS
jgi:hypothetical protein